MIWRDRKSFSFFDVIRLNFVIYSDIIINEKNKYIL